MAAGRIAQQVLADAGAFGDRRGKSEVAGADQEPVPLLFDRSDSTDREQHRPFRIVDARVDRHATAIDGDLDSLDARVAPSHPGREALDAVAVRRRPRARARKREPREVETLDRFELTPVAGVFPCLRIPLIGPAARAVVVGVLDRRQRAFEHRVVRLREDVHAAEVLQFFEVSHRSAPAHAPASTGAVRVAVPSGQGCIIENRLRRRRRSSERATSRTSALA